MQKAITERKNEREHRPLKYAKFDKSKGKFTRSDSAKVYNKQYVMLYHNIIQI